MMQWLNQYACFAIKRPRDFCRTKRTDCHKRLCRAVRVQQDSSCEEEQTSGVAIFEIIGFRCMNPSVVMAASERHSVVKAETL
jgi:hypothetical protein